LSARINMKMITLLVTALVCMLLIKCTHPKQIRFSQIQSPTKFNGKVVNNIYYDDSFHYKIKSPLVGRCLTIEIY